MKKINLIPFVIVAFQLPFFTGLIFGQAMRSDSMLIPEAHIIKSSFNSKPYRLYVSLPKNYLTSDTIHYPVLYVLDAKYSYPLLHSTRQVMDMGRELEDVIIVGIGDDSRNYDDWLANRHADFTPSGNPQNDTLFTKILNLKPGQLRSGGAKLFLNTLKKGIIPFIENKYKTNGDRGITGHSLGGLFAAYCLLTSPELFTRYGINSPSLWWNEKELTMLENSFARDHPAQSAKLFISVGKLEGDMMTKPMANFVAAIIALHNKGLIVTSHQFDDETHVSVVPACYSRTLKVLYSRR